MDGTCRTYRREEKCLLTFGRKTWREEKRPLWRAVWRWEELIVHFPFFIWHRLHRKCQTNSSSTVLFVAAATSVSSGSIIPAFRHHVTLLIPSHLQVYHHFSSNGACLWCLWLPSWMAPVSYWSQCCFFQFWQNPAFISRGFSLTLLFSKHSP